MNKFFQDRKVRFLIAFFLFLLLIDLIQESYAKYTSSAEATGQFAIAEWSFKINDQDIITNNDFSATIVPEFDTNQYIADDVIAPTSTGHFEVEIDSSDVGVAFDEEITLSIPQDSPVQDIRFTGYKLNNGTVVQLSSASPTITTSHSLNEVQTTNTYTFYIEWLDGTGETMDNADDTEAAGEGSTVVSVNVNFIQRAS